MGQDDHHHGYVAVDTDDSCDLDKPLIIQTHSVETSAYVMMICICIQRRPYVMRLKKNSTHAFKHQIRVT